MSIGNLDGQCSLSPLPSRENLMNKLFTVLGLR
jgi:hypothetical protein